MRPTIGRCPNRTTSKTSMLTLNEQRNLRSIYQMHETRYLFKFFFHRVKFFSKNIAINFTTDTVRTEKLWRQGARAFLSGEVFYNDIRG
jgi:hypothetical protein